MIIAEISQNFTNLDEAKNLVRLAKENGAKLAKAQLFDSMKLYGKHVPAELSFEQAKALFDYGKVVGIEVFFSVFDVERVKWCEEIGVKRYKLAYEERSNLDLFRAIVPTRKPIIASTDGVSGAISYWLVKCLYCVPEYPTPLNHLRIPYFNVGIFDGFSDHTIGLDTAKIALSRGAQIIEKHFAIDHKTGIDAEWSMTPEELRELKRFELIRNEVL